MNQVIPDSTYLEFYERHNAYLRGELDTYSYEDMDAQLHRSFIQATSNTYLINTYASIESQVTRMRIITGAASNKRKTDTVDEHLKIIKAALRHDWEEAALAMSEHLSKSKQIFFDYMLNH